MNDHTTFDFAGVPPDVIVRANQQWNVFEAAWKAGSRPQMVRPDGGFRVVMEIEQKK